MKFPKIFSANWDNVGLLVNPSNLLIKNVMVTNDFTYSVLNEAKVNNCNLILCYHPVIFKGTKTLDIDEKSKNALCLDAFSNNIAIYCPHTILDVVPNGINDWILEAFNNLKYKLPIRIFTDFSKYFSKFAFINDIDEFRQIYSHHRDDIYFCKIKERNVVFLKSESASIKVDIKIENIKNLEENKYWGDGRYMELTNELSLNECVELLKKHVKMMILLVAKSSKHEKEEKYIKSVAVCAGSGGSILKGVKADLIITGELDHHSILDFVEKGQSVILTNHSNSERGYLPIYKDQIKEHFMNCGFKNNKIPKFLISKCDKDPIEFI